jgi:hypothetical protein
VQQLEDRTVPSWLAQIGGTGSVSVFTKQDMDAAGNLYVCGNYARTTDFDPGPGTTPHMTTSGDLQDGFVAKYSPDGVLLWAKRFGGADRDNVEAVSVDPTGQWVYATGNYRAAPADFNGDGVPETPNAGGDDVFVLKLDAATGATAWARTVGSKGGDDAGSVVAGEGHVYLTGQFGGTVDFDPGPGTRSLTPAGKGKNPPGDAFVLKLDAGGNHVSSWQIGAAGIDAGRSLVVDGETNTVYLTGEFSATVDFNPGSGVVNKTSAGLADIFLASYNTATPTPTLNWVQTIGNSGSQYAGVLSEDSGSVYYQGIFEGTLDFDPGAGVTNLTAAVYSDGVVARYAKGNGALVWAKGFGGTGYEAVNATAVVDEAAGTIYVGGVFDGAIDLNPGAPGGEYAVADGGSRDGFLVKLGTADGSYRASWRSEGAGSTASLRPIGVRAGTVYATGMFSGTETFPTGGALTSVGSSTNMYVMALDQFTAGPAVAGSPVTLTASNFVDANPATTTTQMAFYADTNNDGVLNPLTDTLLGYGTQAADGTWALSVTFLAPGTYRLFAQGLNSLGGFSDPLALDLPVL